MIILISYYCNVFQKIFTGASCTTMVCGENEYCKTESGAPKCVKKSTGLGEFLQLLFLFIILGI